MVVEVVVDVRDLVVVVVMFVGPWCCRVPVPVPHAYSDAEVRSRTEVRTGLLRTGPKVQSKVQHFCWTRREVQSSVHSNINFAERVWTQFEPNLLATRLRTFKLFFLCWKQWNVEIFFLFWANCYRTPHRKSQCSFWTLPSRIVQGLKPNSDIKTDATSSWKPTSRKP